MKKLFCIPIFIVLHLSAAAGTIDINGTATGIDTLEYWSVGPGVTYSKFKLASPAVTFYMLTVNMSNPYNRVETFQAQDQVGKTEALTNAYTRLSTTKHQAIGGVNANFWCVSGQGQPAELLGMPYSGNARNGEMIGEPSNWNRGHTTDPELLLQEIGFAVVDTANRVWIDDMQFDGTVVFGNDSFSISEVNRNRNTPGTNEIVLFNQYLGAKATRSSTTGTEVVIRPTGEKSWSTNENITCEVLSVNQTGGTTIAAGQAVLSGHGTGKIFLDKLTVGDRLTVKMGIYCSLSKERPAVEQMITGNALVMRNGTLTIRNTNETYNSQTYPRTLIGTSQQGDTLFMLVADPAGTNTTVMCGLLKSCGAMHATSMDGGGSAQMMLRGSIQNNPRDGNERAVSNGWMVFNTAPESNTLGRIEFIERGTAIIPVYASYTPALRAYNTYGTLISTNYQDFTLTCEPNSLGSISADGRTFCAAPVNASGTLTARHGEISVSRPIEIVNGEIHIRLDSVLIDTRTYPIEVLSNTGSGELPIDPSTLAWQVSDETVCTVENGVLRGLSNGSCQIIGTLGEYSDSLQVNVEIAPQAEIIWDDFSQAAEQWTLSDSWKKATFSYSENAMHVQVSYSAARDANVRLSRETPLYGLPDSLSLSINTGNAVCSAIAVCLRANNSTKTVLNTFSSVPSNTDTQLTIAVKDMVKDTSDIAIYPLWMSYIKLSFSSSMTAGDYIITLNDITLYYGNYQLTYLKQTSVTQLQVYPNPIDNDRLQIANYPDNAQAQLFDMQGHTLWQQTLSGKKTTINIPQLRAGSYLLQVGNETVKIIKK